MVYDAARRGDVTGVLWALAHGADVNWAHPRRKGRRAVHAVCEGASAAGVAGMQGWLVCLELLHQNGACLDALDQDEMSPLDVAMNAPLPAPPGDCGGGAAADVGGMEKEGSALALHASWRQQLNQLSVGSASNMGLVSYLLAKLDK